MLGKGLDQSVMVGLDIIVYHLVEVPELKGINQEVLGEHEVPGMLNFFVNIVLLQNGSFVA